MIVFKQWQKAHTYPWLLTRQRPLSGCQRPLPTSPTFTTLPFLWLQLAFPLSCCCIRLLPHATLLLSCSLLFPTSKHHRQRSSGVLYIGGCCLITFSLMCWYRLCWYMVLGDHQPHLRLLSVLSSFSTWYPAPTETNEQRVQ